MSDSLASQSDAELLKQFSNVRCERVFEELVSRYGRLVMAICLRTLRNQHDAEDVFQATFLVLAEKAKTIKKRNSLSSWLTGTAHRLSIKLAQKRHRKDLALTAEPVAARDQFSDLERRFDEQAMDEELHALPSKYRDVLVRFYFLGETSRQIAESLGITQGAADGRIKRGRQELRVRLAKRGVALGALTVMAFSAQTASAAVAPTLVQSTVAAAVAKGSVGLVSSSVVKLAGSELMKTSSMISSAAAASAVLVFLALGTFGLNAAFARAAMPGELSLNTRVDGDEPEAVLPVVALAQEGNAAKAVDAEIQKPDVPRDEKVAADPRRGSDVYQLKAHTIDGQIEAAKTVAPNAHYRKRSDRMIVDGSGAELAKVQELFKKFGVAPVSQQRMDATPSRLGRLKAAELRPVSQVKGEFARTEGSDFADVYKFSKLEPFEVLERVKAKFPTVRATVNGSRLVVLGDLGQRKAVENEIKRIDPKVEQDEVPVRTPMPSRSTPATASAHRPPRFVTGRLSQDGESIMVLDPSVAKPRLGTYRVRRPYTEIAKDENGDNKRVTKFLTETHTPWVEQKNATEPRTVYKRANIKITTVGRVPIPAADLATAFDGKRPVILLRGEQQISPLYQKVLRPGIAVIIVPIEEASK